MLWIGVTARLVVVYCTSVLNVWNGSARKEKTRSIASQDVDKENLDVYTKRLYFIYKTPS